MKPLEAMGKLPGLLWRGNLSFAFDHLPLASAHLSRRQRLNLVTCGLDRILGSSRMRSLPPTVMIEPTNICSMQCPLCPTGSGSSTRERGFMTTETFGRIMEDLGDTLVMAILYGWGEPFLNRDLPLMIEECTRRNIRTVTDTNGQCIQTLDEALQVVDAGLDGIIIALDGSTQDIYRSYRQSGDIEKVKRCAALIEEAKQRRGASRPYTNIRAVVTRHNEHDLDNIARLARDLSVNMVSFKNLGTMSHVEEYRRFEPDSCSMRRFDYRKDTRARKSQFRCIVPFRNPMILWDGTVVPCEFDYNAEVAPGNIREMSFRDMWNTLPMRSIRRRMNRGLSLPLFCERCPLRDRARDSCVLTYRELRPVKE